MKTKKKGYLQAPVRHLDITSIDAVSLVKAMKGMSFTARDLAAGADLFERMLKDRPCSVILCIAGSTSAAGCMNIYADLVKYNMVDAIVATGAAIVDMDFFEALGFRHYQGSPLVDDKKLRSLYIDRIYDTFIDEEELQNCDRTIGEIADTLPPGIYSSREFIREMGRFLKKNARKKGSLVETAFDNDVPIFCPAFSDSSAGFGLVMHQTRRPDAHVSIDSVKDFRELTQVKIKAKTTGLVIIGGGVPKNFAQDTVICAGFWKEVPMTSCRPDHRGGRRDGACSSSTLKEASSWGKVDGTSEQMVYAEATSVLPLMASYVYHRGAWKKRRRRPLEAVSREDGKKIKGFGRQQE